MKKIGVLVILLIIAPLVLADIDIGVDAPIEEVEKVQEAVESIPITPSGEVDQDKLDVYKNKTKTRLDFFNDFLDKKFPWSIYIFRMKAQISWLFTYNLLIMIFYLQILVLQAKTVFGFIKKSLRKSKINPNYICYGIGLAIFIILLYLNFYVKQAYLLDVITNVWWKRLLIIAVSIGIIMGINVLFSAIKESRKQRIIEDAEKTNEEVKEIKEKRKEEKKQKKKGKFKEKLKERKTKEDEEIEEEAKEEAESIEAEIEESE